MNITLPKRANLDTSPSQTAFTLADHQASPYSPRIERPISPALDSKRKRADLLRKTGTFGTNHDSEYSRGDSYEAYEDDIVQRQIVENSRDFSESSRTQRDEEVSIRRHFIGPVQGNLRIKFDIRKKNLNIAEFRDNMKEYEESQKKPEEKGELNTLESLGIEKRLQQHKEYVTNLFTAAPAPIAANQQRRVTTVPKLVIEKAVDVTFVPEAKGNEPTYSEIKRLLEITEEELFEANQRIRDLEKKKQELIMTEKEQHIEALEKVLDVNLDNIFEFVKGIKGVLETDITQFEGLIGKYEEPVMENDSKTTDGSVVGSGHKPKVKGVYQVMSHGEADELRGLARENEVCVQGITKLDMEAIKKSILKSFERIMKVSSENETERTNEIEKLEKMTMNKLQMYKEELQMSEKKTARLYTRITELEGLLSGREGLTSTARKLIDLEKKLHLCQEENEKLERQNRKLHREKEQFRTNSMEISSQYEMLKKGLTREPEKSERAESISDEPSVMQYIQKLEEELLASQANIKKMTSENQALSGLNTQRDVEIKNYDKLVEELRIDKQSLEAKIRAFEELQKENERLQVLNETANHEKMAKLKEDLNHAQEKLQTVLSTTHEAHEPIVIPQQSHVEDRDTIKKEAIEQLSLMILSKDKAADLSDEAKRVIKEIFGEGFSKLIDTYEQRIKLLKDHQRDLHKALWNEMKGHMRTAKELQSCSEPLFELLLLFDQLKLQGQGSVHLSKFVQRIQKRKQALLDATKDAQTNFDRLNDLSNDLITQVDLDESDVSSHPLYKPLDERLGTQHTRGTAEEEDDEDQQSVKQENTFLRREIDYLSQKIDGLKLHNQNLEQQMEKMKVRAEETQEHLNAYSSSLGSGKRKGLNLKSPRTMNKEKLSTPVPQNKRYERLEKENQDSSKRSSMRPSQTKGRSAYSNDIPIMYQTDGTYVEDLRGMVMLQATLIEHWLGSLNKEEAM